MTPPAPDENSLAAYVQSFSALLHYPLVIPQLPALAPTPRAVDQTRPLALIVSPHPDDECLTGGLALRLRQEAGFEVLNVAATLGSNRERRSERWNELCHACDRLGFALLDPGFEGREPVTPARRQADPTGWARDVDRLAALLDEYRPRVVFCPHARDGSATHIGVHWLVHDALQHHAHAIWLAQTEFWGTLEHPSILVELGSANVAALIGALTCHRGEVARNPYHLRLMSWLADSVRRGGEAVFGAGTQPPAFDFGALYRLERWAHGHPATTGRPLAIAGQDSLKALFDEGVPPRP
ncbi:PIG-L deacetylase family protein [Caballeronia sp. DA-9]|uniref:PIG-L deacetylase family protein n=1 Tax=Caballeronia sp. DA-9 TaxID=3436237 RepID=UPI003F669215